MHLSQLQQALPTQQTLPTRQAKHTFNELLLVLFSLCLRSTWLHERATKPQQRATHNNKGTSTLLFWFPMPPWENVNKLMILKCHQIQVSLIIHNLELGHLRLKFSNLKSNYYHPSSNSPSLQCDLAAARTTTVSWEIHHHWILPLASTGSHPAED